MIVSAILLMAGSGQRFKKNYPKQFYRLSGIPIYLHTLNAFLKSNLFHEIILSCNASYIEKVKSETAKYSNVKVVLGGATRQESSFNAIKSCTKNCEIVLIHDAVRPFVTADILKKNIQLAKKHKAVNTCVSSFDTIIETVDQKTIKSIPDRKSLMRGQTPQTFSYELIKQAHETAFDKKIINATDDCQLVLMLSHPIYICEGSDRNIKITTPFDLIIAKQTLKHSDISKENPKKSLQKMKYILIGASGGIGLEIRKLIEEDGGIVIPVSLKRSKYKMDLKNKKSINKTLNEIYEEYGLVDGLINTAGLLHRSALSELTENEIENLIQVNFTGVVLCCKHARIKRNGHIINISSSSYYQGRKNHSVYSSTKAALVNFTQAIAEEKKDLYINTIAPHRTDTAMRRLYFKDENPKDLLSPKAVAIEVIDILKSKQSSAVIEVTL